MQGTHRLFGTGADNRVGLLVDGFQQGYRLCLIVEVVFQLADFTLAHFVDAALRIVAVDNGDIIPVRIMQEA